jgi:mannose-1-phosphate guanylyltransferase
MKTFPTTQKDRWAVILAGGDGNRLRPLTRTLTGDERPKQFAPIIGRKTLLDQTRERVALAVSEENTLLVVTKKHQEFYRSIANTTRLVVQPENKGTALGIIYPLMRIAAEAPNAIVAIFPSDHYFSDDETFMSHVEAAFESSRKNPNSVTLLGITPDHPEVEFGWIEPNLLNKTNGVAPVRRFWEKPPADLARQLMDQGCLWNSFVMVGHVQAFLAMTKRALPELFSYFEAVIPVFGTPDEYRNVRAVYSWLPELNFSHHVLAVRPEDLGVMRVDNVGWSDLGDPARVLATLSRIGLEVHAARTAS